MSPSTHYRKPRFLCGRALRCLGPVIVSVCLCAGCLVPASRMESCQARYHQLSEKNKSLQTDSANLETTCRQLQSERDQSEQELVFLDKEVPSLFAKQQDISQPPAAAGRQLKELATGTDGLDFDAASGAVSLRPSIFFRTGTELKTESGEPLGTLATVFNESTVRGHRVLIVTSNSSRGDLPGHQKNLQRAITLMGFFRQWGIEKNRLGVSNYGNAPRPRDIAATENNPRLSEEAVMKIYLVDDDVPVIGWNAPQVPLYR
ncbi:MAG: taxilin [Planctomycetales bacterium]